MKNRLLLLNEDEQNSKEKLELEEDNLKITDGTINESIKHKSSLLLLNESVLNETKEDKKRFVQKFGEEAFRKFNDSIDILSRNGISTDIRWHNAHTSVEEMEEILSNNATRNERDKTELEQILEDPRSNDVIDRGKFGPYRCYEILSPQASVKYGLVVGGRAGWCISGGYENPGYGEILDQAEEYFYQYLDDGDYTDYYFLISNKDKYALCYNRDEKETTIWNREDKVVGTIKDLDVPVVIERTIGGEVIYSPPIKFVVPEGTKIIELDMFEGMNISEVVIPNSVVKIDDGAFYHCKNLTSITIPNSVTSIGNSAFSGCSSLTTITIPNSVTSIGNSVFRGCSSLTSITIPNSVTSIGGSAFSSCSSLTSITIPSSVTSIGNSAFCGCTSLTSITIPSSVTSIGNSAFECSALKSITIPNSVTSIGDNAFEECVRLASITISNSVTSIGNRVFRDCTSLTTITIPNSVTSIGRNAFSGCTSLTSITIPNSVTSIGNFAFLGCVRLKSITYQGTKEQWNSFTEEISWNYSSNIKVVCTDGVVNESIKHKSSLLLLNESILKEDNNSEAREDAKKFYTNYKNGKVLFGMRDLFEWEKWYVYSCVGNWYLYGGAGEEGMSHYDEYYSIDDIPLDKALDIIEYIRDNDFGVDEKTVLETLHFLIMLANDRINQ